MYNIDGTNMDIGNYKRINKRLTEKLFTIKPLKRSEIATTYLQTEEKRSLKIQEIVDQIQLKSRTTSI